MSKKSIDKKRLITLSVGKLLELLAQAQEYHFDSEGSYISIELVYTPEEIIKDLKDE